MPTIVRNKSSGMAFSIKCSMKSAHNIFVSPVRFWNHKDCIGTGGKENNFLKLRQYLGGIWDCSAPHLLPKRFQLHALDSRKNGGVVRAPKEVLHKLWFFVELLHGEVCGAVWNTLLIELYLLCIKSWYIAMTKLMVPFYIFFLGRKYTVIPFKFDGLI
jgi:hypothetical protein